MYIKTYRTIGTILEETLHDHLENLKQHQNDGDKKIEYDLVDVLIKEMENDNGEAPITFDSIKAAILVSSCKLYSLYLNSNE
jgi:hypothetical protein